VWLHPVRTPAKADYVDEPRSYYDMWWAFGWPFETSVAMGRIVFSGMFDKYPNLAVICHHMGAMIPYFEGRVGPGLADLVEGLFRARPIRRRNVDGRVCRRTKVACTSNFSISPLTDTGGLL